MKTTHDTSSTAEIEAHIRKVVAKAPPLTEEQRDHLARIIRSSQEVKA